MPDIVFATPTNENAFVTTGNFPAQTVFTVSWTGVSVTSPCGSFGYQVNLIGEPGTLEPGTLRYALTTTSAVAHFTIPASITSFAVSANTDTYCSSGTLFGVDVSWVSPAQTYCQYGTELSTGGDLVYYLTPALIDAWCAAVDMPWIAFIFAPLWYTTFNASNVCSALPPPFPTIDLQSLSASVAELTQWLEAIAWTTLCQCKPGTPAPLPPPPASSSQPAGWPSQPTLPCSDTDLCSALVAIQAQLQAMQTSIVDTLGLTTAIQRFRVPFAYIGGKQHTGLTGTGSFTISRLVGLQVVVSSVPQSLRTLAGNPPYLWDVGWMSVSDGGGMLQQRRIARQSMVWIPDQTQDATLFGWFVNDGFTIDVVELEPEP